MEGRQSACEARAGSGSLVENVEVSESAAGALTTEDTEDAEKGREGGGKGGGRDWDGGGACTWETGQRNIEHREVPKDEGG